MDAKHEELTAAEHAERAQSQGQTVVEYCRQSGLSVHALYSARRQLKEKGCWQRLPSGGPQEAGEVHDSERCGVSAGGCLPFAPSERLGD